MLIFARLRSSRPWKMVTFRTCARYLSRHFTNIFLDIFQRIIFRFWTKWTHNKNESLLKPRQHLNMLVTFYLVDFALCIGSIVRAFLLNGRTLPIDWVASGRVCTQFTNQAYWDNLNTFWSVKAGLCRRDCKCWFSCMVDTSVYKIRLRKTLNSTHKKNKIEN